MLVTRTIEGARRSSNRNTLRQPTRLALRLRRFPAKSIASSPSGAMTREAALATAKDEARSRAAAAGADPGSITIVDVEDVPLAYLPGNAIRVRVKAVGDLELRTSLSRTRIVRMLR